MTEQESRIAFETWVQLHHPKRWPNMHPNGTVHNHGVYYNSQLQAMWLSWKAAVRQMAAKINTPQIDDFSEAVKNEAVHQRERWSAEHEGGKADEDWLFLVGFLGGKAVQCGKTADLITKTWRTGDGPRTAEELLQKRLHHIITAAAVLLNWHANLTGTDTRMRPGIKEPS